MQYLREEQFYFDLYDLMTVKDCLSSIDSFKQIYQKNKIGKDASKDDKFNAVYAALNLDLFFLKGERFLNRKERIEEMIAKDKEKQELLDSATEPKNIFCNICGAQLHSELKILEDYMDKPYRVLFYFPCKTCKKKRAFYNTGEEYITKPELCQNCGHEIQTSYKKVGKKINTIRKCTSCSFSETEIDNFEEDHEKWEEEQNKDKKLLEQYRAEYCLSEKEGQEYLESKVRITELGKIIDKHQKDQADPAYQKAKKLKKLSVVELEKLLVKTLEKEKYIKLALDKPEIGQYVIIPFTVQESDSTRKEYDTTAILKKLLKNTLEDTNWRLMFEGVSYRLGYVYGRLKGYEREEDLAELMRIKVPKDNPFMVDENGPIY